MNSGKKNSIKMDSYIKQSFKSPKILLAKAFLFIYYNRKAEKKRIVKSNSTLRKVGRTNVGKRLKNYD